MRCGEGGRRRRSIRADAGIGCGYVHVPLQVVGVVIVPSVRARDTSVSAFKVCRLLLLCARKNARVSAGTRSCFVTLLLACSFAVREWYKWARSWLV